MFDQTMTIQSLRNIILMENRKGNYLVSRFMPGVTRLDRRISTLISYRKIIIGNSNIESKETTIERINELIERIREKREKEVDQHLKKIISALSNKNFKVAIHPKTIDGSKPKYVVDDKPESYFVLKHLQYCLSKLYKVKQSNRSEIVSQLAGILDDDFSKYIYRTDVQNFYESIPEAVLDHIKRENLLSSFNKRILIQIMEQYYSLLGSRVGVPRGIGVSAYLAELYMREFDRQVSLIKDLVFYRRYVDDMIFIFVPSSLANINTYKSLIDDSFSTFSLKKNTTKSKAYGLIDSSITSMSYKFDFLGYSFHYSGNSLSIGLSEQKIKRIRARIDAVFVAYVNDKVHNKRKEDRLLLKRLHYLAGNTKLHNRKSNILIGIYFSNPLVNCLSQLKKLDRQLSKKINDLHPSKTLLNRLKCVSFDNGFTNKKFSILTQRDFQEISECWKGMK